MVRPERDLPWQLLTENSSDVPWEALTQVAQELQSDPGLMSDLEALYAESLVDGPAVYDHGALAVPAIIAMAAPGLDEGTRGEIAGVLVRWLDEAGREDSDLLCEVFMAAAGTIGPAVLPHALEAIARQRDTYGAWVYLWALLLTVGDCRDCEVRARVESACHAAIRRAEHDEDHPMDAACAARVLAVARGREVEPLVERLARTFRHTFEAAEFTDILDGLRDGSDLVAHEMWREPVESWLAPLWRALWEFYEDIPLPEDLPDFDLAPGESEALADTFPGPLEVGDPDGPFLTFPPKTGRNDPCPCGSGRKHKHCCGKPGGPSRT